MASSFYDYVGADWDSARKMPLRMTATAVQEAEQPAEPSPTELTQRAMQHLISMAASLAHLPLDEWLRLIRRSEASEVVAGLTDEERDNLRIMKGTIKAAQPLQRFVLEEQKRQQAKEARASGNHS